MKLVADANILFSALLKKGTTRRLWFNKNISLVAPQYLIAEFSTHRKELIGKYSGTEKEFDEMLERLLKHMRLATDGELKPYLPAAASLSRDSKDWLYLACALKENAAIWTHDKEFGKQKRVPVKKTEGLAREAGTL